MMDRIDRREVLKLMGAFAVLAAGPAGCVRKPKRHIVSRADGPEYRIPGTALHYSSTATDGPFPYGIMIRTVDGRPVKIEGNPDHPVNQGSTTAAMQASLLSLYDPDRFDLDDWAAADRRIVDAIKVARRVVLITRSTLGPSERDLVDEFLQAVPGARHFVHETVHDGPRRSAWRALYGADGEVIPRFDRARVILSLDSDFLGTDGVVLENIRRFTEGRSLPSRLYVIESAMTLTGSNADHRLAARPSEIGAFLKGGGAVIDDLRANRGAALIVAGPHLSRHVHEVVARLNHELDAPMEWNPQPAALPVTPPKEIVTALAEGVDVLLLLGVNPVVDFPGGDFAKLLTQAKLSVGHGLVLSETLSACSIRLPSSHPLESWNDAAPRPGVESICQPVIAPLRRTRQEAESLLKWTQGLSDGLKDVRDWHDFVKRRWRDAHWEDVLRAGGRFQPKTIAVPRASAAQPAPSPTAPGDIELVIVPHPFLHDGRFAGNPWLRELPDPVTRVVWDDFASMGPGMAGRLGVSEGDIVTVQVGTASIELPALIQNGMADRVIIVRTTARLVGAEDPDTPHLALHAQAAKAVGRKAIIRFQETFSQEGRSIVLDGTIEAHRKDPDLIRRHRPHGIAAPAVPTQGPKWAMAVDLGACVGCGACVAACQVENNIPAVGREECAKRREMHWIRIDRYEEPDGRVHHLPVLCQHCDNAPCETVCPVNATTHSPEGLNEMTYNRCVGTRYCSNNCPYKVRRFNFFNFQKRALRAPVQELVHNPRVTVRGVGVMEKCTFCIQRIVEARGKSVAPQPACAQACPARAITFGDATVKGGSIVAARASGRAFHVLEQLNVKPNVTYLARLRNPNPNGGRLW